MRHCSWAAGKVYGGDDKVDVGLDVSRNRVIRATWRMVQSQDERERVKVHTDLLLSGRVGQDVVLGLQQVLDLRRGRIDMNPSLVEGQMKTVASDAGFHQPLTNLIDSLGT